MDAVAAAKGATALRALRIAILHAQYGRAWSPIRNLGGSAVSRGNTWVALAVFTSDVFVSTVARHTAPFGTVVPPPVAKPAASSRATPSASNAGTVSAMCVSADS